MRPRSLVTALLAPLVISGCGSARGGRVPNNSATLEVRNSYLGPVDLYAIRSGTPQRLGTALSSRPERFRLGPSLIGSGESIRIIAIPLAENGRASTGTINVRPGDIVQFNVSSTLSASSVFIRSADQ